MEQNHGDGKSQALGRVMPQPYYASRGKVTDRDLHLLYSMLNPQDSGT